MLEFFNKRPPGDAPATHDITPQEKDQVRQVIKQYDTLLDAPGTHLDVQEEALTTQYRLTNREQGVQMVLTAQKHGQTKPLVLKDEYQPGEDS